MTSAPTIDPPDSHPAYEPLFHSGRLVSGPALVHRQFEARAILDQENRIRVAIDDLVEFLNVMGAD